MNVLQVNTVYPNGSTGRIVAEIAAYTAAQPDTRALAAFGIGESSRENGVDALRFGSPAGRKFHGAIRKLLDAEGYGSLIATGQLIKFCRENQVDVVHLHNLHGCYINLKRWFRYLEQAGIPVVWTLHDCWPMTGHCAYFNYAGCERWKTQCIRCPEKHSYPECVGFDGSRRNYRLKKRLFSSLPNLTIVTPCRWLADIVRESYLHNAQTRVIYNGVDTERFQPVASHLRKHYGLERKRVLLSVASDWDRRKGLDSLIGLSELLNEPYRIVIIGLTREQLSALPKNVLGLERTASQQELAAWYTAADCFVNPTLDDTMPLVNLEALACGTPIVVYDTGGCREAVDESCGTVVAKGDIQELAVAVKQICESDANYADACLQRAMRFSKQNMARAYYELYREVLS
ncbi:MAG: glycosyltransferase [Clostridiales bacterium]|nr:glycosyltransferase [Clostridiales bacterium]